MVVNDANLYLLKTKKWDRNHYYWTLDIDGERVIIKYSGSFRSWRCIRHGYPLPVRSKDVGALSRHVTSLSVDNAANTYDDGAHDQSSEEQLRDEFRLLERLGLARKSPAYLHAVGEDARKACKDEIEEIERAQEKANAAAAPSDATVLLGGVSEMGDAGAVEEEGSEGTVLGDDGEEEHGMG
ncbi:hypothetical protein Q9189_000649 [Teloschistes chrysophthalmus]